MSEIIQHQQTGLSVFEDAASFEHAQRMVAPLAKSTMIPTAYQNNIPNCIVALEMSYRLKQSVLMVMQNTSVIHGKPSLDSKFIIALINASGRFSEPLNFVIEGEAMEMSCYAVTKRNDGSEIKGPKVTMQMAHAEGWINKAGSKWKTMPELMIQYRSAAFFGRLHCPDVLMGMQAQDEAFDVGYVDTSAPVTNGPIADINSAIESEAIEFEDVNEMEVVHEAVPETSFTAPAPPDMDDDDF